MEEIAYVPVGCEMRDEARDGDDDATAAAATASDSVCVSFMRSGFVSLLRSGK